MGDYSGETQTIPRDHIRRVDDFIDCNLEGLVVGSAERPVLLRGVGRQIWHLTEYPTKVDAVCGQILAEFAVDPETCRREVMSFIAVLEHRNLIRRCSAGDPQRDRYLWLLKRTLTNLIYPEDEQRLRLLSRSDRGCENYPGEAYIRDIRYRDPGRFAELVRAKETGKVVDRGPGRYSHTMVGLHGLNNIERLAEQIFVDGIPGDFVDAGTCRGGCAILMRALQRSFGASERQVWVADTFAGVPASATAVDVDAGIDFTGERHPWMVASRQMVEDNFRAYGLLDQHVRFLAGLFADTLPDSGIGTLALLRLDADLYGSTLDCLDSLYDRIAPGGFIIVDDYGAFPPCRAAVDGFRAKRGIIAPISRVNWNIIYWRKDA